MSTVEFGAVLPGCASVSGRAQSGAADPVSDDELAEFVRVADVPGAGQFLVHEAPDRVLAEINTF